jgi:5-formyltetrahydrofolate cyclo-ligase
MTKAELRQKSLINRRALTMSEVNRRSQLIAGHFFTYFEHNGLANAPATIHSFLPIRRHNEVDTWPIIECLWKKFGHIQISVPVVDQATHQMEHYTIFPNTPLVENRLGIPQPAVGSRYKTDLEHITAVLVPLLAFDQQGHRVGYGGGYYDRFLAASVPNSRKIGLSLFAPVKQIDNVELTDVKLDACITPDQVYKFD